MRHHQAITLIEKAVIADSAEHWADLGCGAGTFTKALADLLPEGSEITAIDREQQQIKWAGVKFVQADFVTAELPLSGLDGILMANALHFVKDKRTLLTKLETYFKTVPQFIVVQYDTDASDLWVPFPLSFSGLTLLCDKLGYRGVKTGSNAVSIRRSTIFSAYQKINKFYYHCVTSS